LRSWITILNYSFYKEIIVKQYYGEQSIMTNVVLCLDTIGL